MSSLSFKRFFEVRLLHEYYFMQADGTSMFDKKQTDWSPVLAEKVVNNRYNITNDLLIEPTDDCRKQLTNYHIRFVIKPTGFILSIEVQTDQKTPKIPFSGSVYFRFMIHIKNPNFSSITTESINRNSYYFSNRPLQLKRSRTAPILSNAIANFTKKKTYITGELVQKTGKLQIARKNTNSDNASDWMPLSDQISQYAYVNNQDTCQFMQHIFQYQAPEPIKKISAKLFADGSTNPIKTISLNFDSPVQAVSLDFSEDDKNNKLDDDVYLLIISYNGKAEESSMVYLSDTLAALQPYALIEISTEKTDDFSVLTSENLIRQNHRTFDLLFKSRATYWRYRSANQKKLTKPDGYDFLTEKAPDLITVDPRVLSVEASSFQKTISGVSTTVFLPSPDIAFIQQGDDVLYSDAFVSKV